MNNDKQHAYINIENNKLIITIFNENKLIFNNTFKYISAEDILYYTLFSFEQLKIDREKVEVNLFGDINDKDETFKLLYEYIRNIHIAKDEKKFIFPVESSIKSENTHYTLLHSII